MYEIDKTKFGSFISEHRKEKGYTQKQLAEHLFISDKAVSKWETGISIPDAALWIPLANLLGVTVTELLMCQRAEETKPMSSDQVENLVKTVISFSDDNPVHKKQRKKQQILLFCACLIISCIENLLLYSKGFMSDNLLLFDLLSILFGFYFVFLAKEKLPTYYDENKITSYSDGIFRMNVPGLAFNNSNWLPIIHVGKIWSMSVLIGYPAMYGVFNLFFGTIWNAIGSFISLGIVLGGLFIPMYIVGKKYQ